MKLFDVYERTDESHRRRDEACYAYLNRSARREYIALRDLLEQWLDRYPQEHAQELQKRFQSVDDGESAAAFFELFVHQFIRNLDCTVRIHPSLPDRAVTPDFEVVEPSSQRLYVEARLVNDQLADDPGVRKRRDRVLAIIDSLYSPDFSLLIDEEDTPKNDPPRLLIESSIRDWLKTLNWEFERRRMIEGRTHFPDKSFDFAGYKVVVEAVARPQEQRNRPNLRTIGATAFGEGAFITPGANLRKAIKEKASKYGDLSAPFILCLNVMDSSVWGDRDISDALFGDDQIVEVKEPSGAWKTIVRRLTNGAFIHRKPQNTRVSGILAFRHLYPWSLSTTEVRLFHNPWTRYPYEGVFNALPTAQDVNGTYVVENGRSVQEVLAL
jgi:hypothetical protein